MTFLPIQGYEDYLINKRGVVISLPKKCWNGYGYFISKKKTLKHSRSNGYATVGLTKEGKTKNIYLHRLLAIAFIPNPSNKNCINHKDGNKLNNSINNIEWCTLRENMQHAFRTGLNKGKPHYGESNSFCKFSNEVISKVRQLSGKQTLGKVAEMFDMSIPHVWAIQNNKTRTEGETYAK